MQPLLRFITFILIATSSAPASAFTGDPAAVRVQLKGPHQFQFAGYYAAIENGYFREAGIEVTLIEGGPAIDPVDQVLAGNAEFGIGSSALLISKSKGWPVMAVAAIFQHSPYVLIAGSGAGVREVQDLAYKSIMADPHAGELLAYLHRQGVDLNTVVTRPHTGNPLDLATDQAAAMTAYTTTDPFVLDQAGILYQTFDPRSEGVDYYGDTLFAARAFAERNEELVVAFRDALAEGWRYALEHEDETIDLILRDYAGRLSRERLEYEAAEIRRLLIPDLIEVGYMSRARWRQIAADFRDAGLLERDVDLDRFLFEASPTQNWTWVYRVTLVAGLAILAAALAVGKFYKLNRSLQAEIRARKVLESELKWLSITDPVTSVLNRRGFLSALQRELKRVRRYAKPFALLTLDLDDFKRINDTYGHAAGDRALVAVAAACRSAVRDFDIVGRSGGEEFVVGLPEVDRERAEKVAERIRRAVEDIVVQIPAGPEFSVTTSIGVAMRQRDENLDSLMSRSDRAVYDAKHLGRNCVVIADEDLTHKTAG